MASRATLSGFSPFRAACNVAEVGPLGGFERVGWRSGIGGQRAGGIQDGGDQQGFTHFNIHSNGNGMIDSEFTRKPGFHNDRPET
jgi:hypothetical protein